ncbi:3-dehydroquinate dehydratase [Halococcus morrhuae DSM 1307]|uniref:3-dehydroquinate dehydratase n=1 Tax=Halococcus morrhuae DSM 1307 TaxID=931277 RepID=M0MFR6_HALMO|nr:type I 3-dehydroquinate dehydratase [Halococcus morrhuae]EMA44541.1 3-dehydroquinate dehydratase [Halococcus morrhuae DSM 1307]
MDFDSLVLAAATADLSDEPAARAHADAVEFRMDLANDPLDALATYDGELPLIATNRTIEEGGEAPENSDRLDTLSRAAEFPTVAAIDVELATITDEEWLADEARDHDADCIVSTHDFDATPSRSAMENTLTRASEYGTVAKLAVTATDPGDVLDLLAATHARTERGDRVATMAMDAVGGHSRAIAPLYGSRIAYAPVDPDRATAPGQYDLATLAGLLDTLD